MTTASVDPLIAALAAFGINLQAVPVPTTKPVMLGAFCANLTAQAAAFKTFETYLGRNVDFALAFTDSQPTWAALGGIGWATADMAPTGRPVCWSVPMLPINGDRLNLSASGTQDAYYTQAAQALAAYPFKLPDGTQLVRIAWEFPSGYPWQVAVVPQNTPANYIATYIRMVNAFRAVSSEFRFVWCANSGSSLWGGGSPALCYPGDAYVNFIGTDAYQNPAATTWGSQLSANGYGANWAYNFAQCKYNLRSGTPKPFILGETGVVNGGAAGTDAQGAQFINDLYSWVAGKDQGNIVRNVGYICYWNGDAGSSYDAELDQGTKPLSAAAFKATFGKTNLQYIPNTTPVIRLPASPDRTVISTVGPTIIDAAGNMWALNSANQVVVNGDIDVGTWATTLIYVGGNVWQFNGSQYYRFTMSADQGNPTGAVGATATSPLN